MPERAKSYKPKHTARTFTAKPERQQSHERGYDHRWRKARAAFLRSNPTCAYCAAMTPPRLTAATVVDHATPHKGDPEIFWDQSRWVSACRECHNRKTATHDGAFGREVKPHPAAGQHSDNG